MLALFLIDYVIQNHPQILTAAVILVEIYGALLSKFFVPFCYRDFSR
jgi:ligand-binding sensor protein